MANKTIDLTPCYAGVIRWAANAFATERGVCGAVLVGQCGELIAAAVSQIGTPNGADAQTTKAAFADAADAVGAFIDEGTPALPTTAEWAAFANAVPAFRAASNGKWQAAQEWAEKAARQYARR